MNMCFVTHKVRKGDGQGRVNYEVILEALRQGHYVYIIASELSDELAQHERVIWKKIAVEGWPTELLRNQIFAIRASLWLTILRNRIDLTIVNGFTAYVRSDINCIHFVHSAWLRSKYHPIVERKSLSSFYQYIYTRLNRSLERMAMKRTRTIVAVSEQVKHELKGDAHIEGNRIAVIRNGVDLEEFYPRHVDRRELHLSEQQLYAMFAGDLRSSRKNLDTVLKALVSVPEIHLLVLGNTKGSLYPQMAADLGLGERVQFLGYRTDMATWMSAADLFVFPSRYEPFALVLLEAMAVGLPVVASSNCGAVELLTNKAAIIINDPDDSDALADALLRCAADRRQLKQMGEEARRLACQHSWSAMAAQYLQLIQETALHKAVPLPES
ncbi:glycosyltransferase family 4 protein [Paenibacillus lupini]|uniref:glycosyltransferase family 4 protein n=1 Tax=Paenibacillus lupini TaxID=1450204 RepID=UPI001423766F|nr:glycosyltransferase family 4 protein [Paenibacillus lupini]NIK26282.1 glycosyltransferase involved in cell wall biosynthesis [Paenibacillus lupini]